MTDRIRGARLSPGRPARAIVAVALGAALLGGATGGVLGEIGAVAGGGHTGHGHRPGVPTTAVVDDENH